MVRRRLSFEASSAVDRDFQRHVGNAEAEIRKAQDVCARARRLAAEDQRGLYGSRQRDLDRALAFLSAVGHLQGAPDPVDLRREARALVAWLEGRERASGIPAPRRSGSDYQARLAQAQAYLGSLSPGVVDMEGEADGTGKRPR